MPPPTCRGRHGALQRGRCGCQRRRQRRQRQGGRARGCCWCCRSGGCCWCRGQHCWPVQLHGLRWHAGPLQGRGRLRWHAGPLQCGGRGRLHGPLWLWGRRCRPRRHQRRLCRGSGGCWCAAASLCTVCRRWCRRRRRQRCCCWCRRGLRHKHLWLRRQRRRRHGRAAIAATPRRASRLWLRHGLRRWLQRLQLWARRRHGAIQCGLGGRARQPGRGPRRLRQGSHQHGAPAGRGGHHPLADVQQLLPSQTSLRPLLGVEGERAWGRCGGCGDVAPCDAKPWSHRRHLVPLPC